MLAVIILALFVLVPAVSAGMGNQKQDEGDVAPAMEPTPEGMRDSAVAMLGMINDLQGVYLEDVEEGEDAVYADFGDLIDAGYISGYQTPETYLGGFDLYWFLSEDRLDYAVVAIPTEFPEMTGLMTDSTGVLMAVVETGTEGDLGPFGPVVEVLDENKDEDTGYSFVDMDEYNEPDFMMDLYLTGDGSEYGLVMITETPYGLNGAGYFGFSTMGYVLLEYTEDLSIMSEEVLSSMMGAH